MRKPESIPRFRADWAARQAVSIALVLFLVLSLAPTRAGATGDVTGTLYTAGATAPAGQVWMGDHLWVSDQTLGFCRVDVAADLDTAINASTCNRAALDPGQPAFDPVHNFAYVPDQAKGSRGVWRLKFDPAAQTVGDATVLAARKGLGRGRPRAVALDPDGNLWIGNTKNRDILQVINPEGEAKSVRRIGKTSDRRGLVGGMAFVGDDLYLAERESVSVIEDAAACRRKCTAQPVAGAGVEVIYVNTGLLPDGTTVPFQFATALDVLGNGRLYVGSDPFNGSPPGQGYVWEVAPLP